MIYYFTGSTFLGYLDYWSGLLFPDGSRYDVDVVLNSTTADILSKINGYRMTLSSIVSLRNNSTIKCNFEKEMRPCMPFKKPCLFHIVKDPCERINLNYRPSGEMRKIVQAKIDSFESMLDQFRKSASKPENVRSTKDANPIFFNNTWTNWGNQN